MKTIDYGYYENKEGEKFEVVRIDQTANAVRIKQKIKDGLFYREVFDWVPLSDLEKQLQSENIKFLAPWPHP